MQCKNCGKPTPETAVFCNHCGTRLVETCQHCSSHNPLGSNFCHVCGNELTQTLTENYNQGQSAPPQEPAGAAPSTTNPAGEDIAPDTSAKHISRDLKDLGHATQNLATDLVSYSTPRIKSFGKRAKSLAERAAVVAVTQYKELVGRLRDSNNDYSAYTDSEPDPMATGRELINDHSARAPVHCPRCKNVIEPDSRYCFSCGLPIDERTTGPHPEAPTYDGRDGGKRDGVPAGFWIRLAAWAIDLAILTVAELALIGVWPGFDVYFDENSGYFHPVDAIAFIGILWYYTLAVSVFQTTIGKRLLGLYVLRADGSRIGPVRALARYFAGILSWVPLGIGYLMIGLRSNKRGLHDLICDTAVVKREAFR